jgi:hypothetical protein
MLSSRGPATGRLQVSIRGIKRERERERERESMNIIIFDE